MTDHPDAPLARLEDLADSLLCTCTDDWWWYPFLDPGTHTETVPSREHDGLSLLYDDIVALRDALASPGARVQLSQVLPRLGDNHPNALPRLASAVRLERRQRGLPLDDEEQAQADAEERRAHRQRWALAHLDGALRTLGEALPSEPGSPEADDGAVLELLVPHLSSLRRARLLARPIDERRQQIAEDLASGDDLYADLEPRWLANALGLDALWPDEDWTFRWLAPGEEVPDQPLGEDLMLGIVAEIAVEVPGHPPLRFRGYPDVEGACLKVLGPYQLRSSPGAAR